MASYGRLNIHSAQRRFSPKHTHNGWQPPSSAKLVELDKITNYKTNKVNKPAGISPNAQEPN